MAKGYVPHGSRGIHRKRRKLYSKIKNFMTREGIIIAVFSVVAVIVFLFVSHQARRVDNMFDNYLGKETDMSKVKQKIKKYLESKPK
ncbi:hypothetical protein ACFL5C_02875 [Candidatus Omnitrophota bacterium]